MLDKIFELEEKILQSGKAMPVLALLAGATAVLILAVFMLMLYFQTPSWFY